MIQLTSALLNILFIIQVKISLALELASYKVVIENVIMAYYCTQISKITYRS